jgi:uncharacterized protein (UPF0548 family)
VIRTASDRVLDALTELRSGARWGAGMAVALWRYASRDVSLERREETRHGDDPGPVDRPVPGDQESVQPRSEGAGASLRRRYRVEIDHPRMSAAALIDQLARDPNVAAPFEVARFVKTSGRLGEMAAGDEYLVWMPGPWNGPVRVAERTPLSFRLATLSGHMEAGEIEFRARDEEGRLVFEIESTARSGSRPFWILYTPLRIAKETQLHMWATFCERAARIAGDPATVIQVRGTRFPDDRGRPRGLRRRRAERTLATLSDRPVNFPERSLQHVTPADGWVVDDHCTPLGREAPGEAAPDGPFAVARELVRDYEFADPGLIRAIYDPEVPLEHRDMLLEGRFLGLRFLLGVRVVGIVDEAGEHDGRPARRWGWSYRTLEGHLETGQMDFEVVKWCDTGEVEFRIHAVSRPAAIPNPLVRYGFRVFGRGLQLRFARTAGERMRHLVGARLAGVARPPAEPPPDVRAAPGASAGT